MGFTPLDYSIIWYTKSLSSWEQLLYPDQLLSLSSTASSNNSRLRFIDERQEARLSRDVFDHSNLLCKRTIRAMEPGVIRQTTWCKKHMVFLFWFVSIDFCRKKVIKKISRRSWWQSRLLRGFIFYFVEFEDLISLK